jgi:hypothetical protein
LTKSRRAQDFSNHIFALLELRIPANVSGLLEEMAEFYNEDLDDMVLNMVLHELDGELQNNEEMGQMISKHLRSKYNFKESEA